MFLDMPANRFEYMVRDSGNGMFFLIAIIILVVIAAAVIIALIIRKNQKKDPGNAEKLMNTADTAEGDAPAENKKDM